MVAGRWGLAALRMNGRKMVELGETSSRLRLLTGALAAKAAAAASSQARVALISAVPAGTLKVKLSVAPLETESVPQTVAPEAPRLPVPARRVSISPCASTAP